MYGGKFSFFALNRALHRDIGFLCVGLTIIYCISGIAVNHVDKWNPNYKIERVKVKLEQAPLEGEPDERWIQNTIRFLNLNEPYKTSFQTSPNQIRIFLEKSVVDVNLRTLDATYEKAVERPFFYEINFLHLNKPKKQWTKIADAYALGLIYLAVSGLFMVKGERGILGRGGWLTLAGIIIPLVFLYYYK